ncbi:cell division protein FtsA [Luteibaculum oceani]|uniref:Cell division protein FtsA n=1 Tax=Luteibaculum oceani TaxID=1294296 RepID=A0A5C6V2K9_9FLAO|nr:cell division protein FtsA [Luteibaculum oceani]TXC78871.1 cell division protein FtsA [Luteibaculum oceani]
MEQEEIVVGLDIGTTKIACIVGRKNEFGKIEIVGMGKTESLGVSRGVVSNIAQAVQSIEEAVALAEKKAQVNIRNVVVGIAGQHIKSYQHRGQITLNSYEEEITQDDVDRLIDDMYKLVTLPGEEILHALPQEYIVDHEQGIKDPVGMYGRRLEANFHVIIGQVAAAKNINRCIDKAGLKLEEIVLEPLASADAVLTKEEKEAGVVLVDIGGGTTDVAIFHDGIIRHSAVIPFGGNVITEDIKSGCAILKNQAEKLKVKFGSALQDESQENEIVCIPGLQNRPSKEISVKNLAGIVQCRMEEIIDHIYYEIKNSKLQDQLIAGIVVTGGGSQLKHIKQLFEYKTGFDTRIGYPNMHLGKSFDDSIGSPSHATGVGLVMKGFNGKQSANPDSAVYNNTVKYHSKARKGNFFKTIFNNAIKILDEEN